MNIDIKLHKNDLPDELKLGNVIAVDGEFMGLNVRRDPLCLIQVSSGNSDAHIVQLDRTNYNAPNLVKLLSDENIKVLSDDIKLIEPIRTLGEHSIEINPYDSEVDNPKNLYEVGINRLSIGIQSFNDSDLKLMNRSHSSDQAFFSLDLIKQNFQNYSIDLIYGIPHSSFFQWKKNLEVLTKNNVPHISTYALTVEPKTALKKLIYNKKIDEVSESNQRTQYDYAFKTLSKLGYVNYEFSSYSKPGNECQNNYHPKYGSQNRYDRL